MYLADVEGDLVLLDARQNAYFCVPRADAGGLKAALTGNSRFRPAADMLDELEAAGLFTTIDTPSPSALLPFLATCDLYGSPGRRAALTPHQIWDLASAFVSAQLAIRFARPERWFRRIARRNAHGRRGARAGIEIAALARLARAAQPFLPGTARCLGSSLFLLGVLHRRGLSARWVFGVRTYPFEAHCWVEHDGMILNDSLEHARSFTPIAAV
ncbi:lasso peptide biosynthesis B2 protein [Sphingomonas sp. HF-S4]|uniref:Lasso peptide biosynthesis B2 protein n=1 Tax=Sphingomonas agrestis TaxID=3080540 RepID=A0ABU3Y381_9SPHN|nr:lasso peptide biosynthesis B2 protein [Sphingomonas sp. HF-S4]MDV3455853.1 lasso peptide biosynthesis B2 protein [Sphingomonas sp. HF-S4]